MKLIIRLDDFSPNRKTENWDQILNSLKSFNIIPLVSVIPNDVYFGDKASDNNFWSEVRQLTKIAKVSMHGFNHDVVAIPNNSKSLIKFAKKSEFLHLSDEELNFRIKKSVLEFNKAGIEIDTFVAPNHGIDLRLLKCLREFTSVKYISDGASYRIYKHHGFIWLPQMDWKIPTTTRFGVRTICLHPNEMSLSQIIDFLSRLHQRKYDSFNWNSLSDIEAPEKGYTESCYAFYQNLRHYFNDMRCKFGKRS